MRVALVCPYDITVPGGVQAHVTRLAERLKTGGDDVLVVAPARHDPPDDVHAVGGSLGVTFNRSVAPIAYSPLAIRRALAALRDFTPAVVHVHEPAAPLLSLGTCLGARHPLVGTFHAWSDRDRLYRAARPLLRAAVARLDACIAVSRPARDYHAAALGLPAGAFLEIPNGVEFERFAAAAPSADRADDAPTVLFVGRLERRKGLEQLVRAFIRVKTQRPSARLVVVGEGPERRRCEAIIPERLRSQVTFVGRGGPDDLPSLYAAADVFAAPALGGESFGIVLLEAMAAGTPVVASAIPGYRTLLRDGVEGRLVPPGDVAALAQALDTLLGNPSLREAMSRAGRETAQRYDWPVVARQVRDVYSDVVERAGA